MNKYKRLVLIKLNLQKIKRSIKVSTCAAPRVPVEPRTDEQQSRELDLHSLVTFAAMAKRLGLTGPPGGCENVRTLAKSVYSVSFTKQYLCKLWISDMSCK